MFVVWPPPDRCVHGVRPEYVREIIGGARKTFDTPMSDRQQSPPEKVPAGPMIFRPSVGLTTEPTNEHGRAIEGEASMLNSDLALKLSGATAIATAVFHAVSGDNTIRDIAMSDDDMSFVTGTYQLGTMGWIAGGVLLIGASRMESQQARNWIVGVTTALYGFPAFGTLLLTGGKPNIGGALLATAVILANVGRKRDTREPDADQTAVPSLSSTGEGTPDL